VFSIGTRHVFIEKLKVILRQFERNMVQLEQNPQLRLICEGWNAHRLDQQIKGFDEWQASGAGTGQVKQGIAQCGH